MVSGAVGRSFARGPSPRTPTPRTQVFLTARWLVIMGLVSLWRHLAHDHEPGGVLAAALHHLQQHSPHQYRIRVSDLAMSPCDHGQLVDGEWRDKFKTPPPTRHPGSRGDLSHHDWKI